MSISLPAELEKFVRSEVANGRYASTDEVLHEAIRILRARERQRDELRKDLQAAVEQIESGDYHEYDDDSLKGFLEELKRETHGAHREAQQQVTP